MLAIAKPTTDNTPGTRRHADDLQAAITAGYAQLARNVVRQAIRDAAQSKDEELKEDAAAFFLHDDGRNMAEMAGFDGELLYTWSLQGCPDGKTKNETTQPKETKGMESTISRIGKQVQHASKDGRRLPEKPRFNVESVNEKIDSYIRNHDRLVTQARENCAKLEAEATAWKNQAGAAWNRLAGIAEERKRMIAKTHLLGFDLAAVPEWAATWQAQEAEMACLREVRAYADTQQNEVRRRLEMATESYNQLNSPFALDSMIKQMRSELVMSENLSARQANEMDAYIRGLEKRLKEQTGQ